MGYIVTNTRINIQYQVTHTAAGYSIGNAGGVGYAVTALDAGYSISNAGGVGYSVVNNGSTTPPVPGVWILETGIWDDAGVWMDAETWNDS